MCLAEGHERRRHEEGLSVLLALSEAGHHLSAVHLCGVPLTPQVARALKTLLPSPPSPLTCAATCVASTPAAMLPAPPLPSAAPSNITLTSLGTVTPRSLAAVSTGPPALPLSLSLYGYDLSRQPAAVAVEMLMSTAAPRLTRLELWGCVGWPKRLSTLLHGCSHLRHVAVSFQPLLPADGAVTLASADAVVPHRLSSQPAASPQQRAASALASGAVVTFAPIAVAVTTAAVVKTVGGLHHLRSLELRGCLLNLVRRASSDTSRPAGGRPRPGVASRAAAERAAIAAAAPSVQQLASALYQLTRLTHLAIDNLNSAAPLLSAVTAMPGLRHLELPDAAAPTAADLAAIARAAPRLASLTLGSVGSGSVLGASGSAAAVTAAPEVLPLPPALAVLRVVRCRPTLRVMRSLRRTVDARAAAAPSPPAAEGAAGACITAGTAARLAVVVPGIEIDMLDVEFDALQGFSRNSDGVLRATLLRESAEALASAIRLLAPPSPSEHGWHDAALGLDTCPSELAGTASGAVPSSVAGSVSLPPCSVSGIAGGAGLAAFGGGGGGSFSPGSCRFASSFGDGFGGGRFVSASGAGGSGIVSTFGGSGGLVGGHDDGNAGGDADWVPPAFGQAWSRELTIHNSQGSLGPPSQEQQEQQQQQPLATAAAAASGGSSDHTGATGGDGGGAAAAGGLAMDPGYTDDVGCALRQHQLLLPPLVGHAVWISEMRPLGLLSLELYGIGVMAGDLEALAELATLRRLTLASGELEVDSLPVLAALPALEYLELTRCHPCRRRRRGAGAGAGSRASTGAGFARPSAGFARPSAGFVRASGASRISYTDSDAAADGDGGEARPTGKRALLELCITAKALRRVFIVRCTGLVTRSEGAEGPLGAEWVRQRLLAAGPRYKGSAAAAAATVDGEPAAGLHRVSWLGRRSKLVAAQQLTEGDLGWPEVRWN